MLLIRRVYSPVSVVRSLKGSEIVLTGDGAGDLALGQATSHSGFLTSINPEGLVAAVHVRCGTH
jgi:hypothetical protein